MKKKLIFGIGAVLLIALIVGGAYLWAFYTSPHYSLAKIKSSIDNHDITTFEKYVDLDSITTRLLTEVPNLLSNKKEMGFLGEEATQVVLGFVKESVGKIAKEAMRAFIERGHFDKSITEKGPLARLLKAVQIDNMEVVELGELKKEGKICKVPLKVYIEAYEDTTTVEFMMRDKGSYWQVAELSNLSNIMHDISEMQRTFPYRNLYGTALNIAKSMENVVWKGCVLKLIATSMAKEGKIERALDIARSIEHSPNNALALSIVAAELAKAGKTERADLVFSEALDIAKSFEEARWKEIALRGIASEMAKAGKIEQALDIAKSMEDRNAKASALTVIAAELARAGKTEQADLIFSEVLDIAKSMENRNAIASALTVITAELARAGKTEQADLIFSEVLDIAKSIERSYFKGKALSAIASELAKAGKTEQADLVFSEALDIARSIKNLRIAKQALVDISLCLRTLSPPLDKNQQQQWAKRIFTVNHVGQISSRDQNNFLEPKGCVNDYAGVIGDTYKVLLESHSREFLSKTGVAIVLVTVENLNGTKIDLYAQEIFNTWGIGTKEENKGVLILLALNERKVRIETGPGIEGVLTDEICGEILDSHMIPHFKKGDYDKGFWEGMNKITSVICDG